MQIRQTRFPAIGGLKWVKAIFFLLLLPHLSWSQVTLKPGPSSEVTISGTSSLHDRVSTVNRIEGQANIGLNEEKLQDIQGLKVTIPVTAIKSGTRSMDKNTCVALKSAEHPEIEYVLTSDDLKPGNVLNTTGELQIARLTKQVQRQVNYPIHAPEKAAFTSEIKINMTGFNVDPPTALPGAIKTG